MKYDIEHTLIIEYTSLPNDIKELIKDRYENFSNDSFLEFFSEFHPKELTLDNLIQYCSDLLKHTLTPGPFLKCIKEYKLELEYFIAAQLLDLSNVDKILFHIEW